MSRERVYPIFLPFAGCPHRCLYCRQQDVGPAQEPPGPGAVRTWLDAALPRQGDGQIAYYGGTFTLLPESLQDAYLEAARKMIAAGRAAGIRISTRPDALDDRVAAGLSEAGVTTVELGCQSFSDPVLRKSGREYAAEVNGAAVSSLRRAGLRCGIQLMPGLPGAAKQEALTSLDSALALNPDFLRIYPTLVLRHTPLCELWTRGFYRPWSLEEAVRVCAEMVRRCRKRGVPVIRVGLQGSSGLESAIVAGPYHPAFGQLVAARLWLRAQLTALKCSTEATVSVHPHDLSDACGHRKFNLLRLRQLVGQDFNILPAAALPRGHIACGKAVFSRDTLLEAAGVCP
jgi:histone acetyltransferase (RNA polymerase elongator complex component)